MSEDTSQPPTDPDEPAFALDGESEVDALEATEPDDVRTPRIGLRADGTQAGPSASEGASSRVGAFVVHEQLGEGGMGVVHRATHAKTQRAVALKFLLSGGRQDRFRAAFEREVQLVARLSHPGIVGVLDYGTVTQEEAKGTSLSAGDPWLAMELARHGSLSDVEVGSWDELKWVLLSVLDALAHAHARGVIHRDLKPGNMLVTEDSGVRALRLADFGIAHLRQEIAALDAHETGSSESAGTPHYMAPEQIRGAWRDFGSWTDLYALGGVAYRLSTGLHLFRGATPWAIWDQHINAPPPGMTRARFGVPAAFEGWVHRLLQKHPRDRFRRAADAAWVLRSMPDPDAPSPLRPVTSAEISVHAGTLTLGDIGLLPAAVSVALGATETAQSQTAPLEELLVDAPSPVGGHVDVIAPMPPDWRTSARPTPAAAYFDVGLGLFGLRAIPLIGREAERDSLWGLLAEVRNRRESRVVTLEGGAGSGKSALAQWLCERAHEVGGASVIRVIHDVEDTPATGLVAAVERYLDCDDLRREAVWERLRLMMAGRCADPALRAAALTELMRPAGDEADTVPPVAFASAAERAIALRDGLSAVVGARPVVLWIDDAHHPGAAAALEAVKALLRADSDLASLVVVTGRAMDGGNAKLLDELAPRRIDLAPPSDDEMRQFVRAILPLSDRATLAVVERAEGVPLFAFQLIADWIRSGRIVARDRGFEADDLDSGALPSGLAELWRSRVDAFVGQSSDSIGCAAALRSASALGRDVRRDELAAVCGQLGVSLPHGFEDALIRAGLATPRREGFSFAHSMLTQVVAEGADAEQLRAVHAACADIAAPDANDHAGILRVARHNLHAGRFEAAADLALEAIEHAWGDDRAARTGGALAIVSAAAEALSLPEADPRVVAAELWRTRGFRVRWDFDEVKARARDLIVTTASDDLALYRAQALVELGLAEGYSGGQLELAIPHFTTAASIFEARGATKHLAEVHSRLAYVYPRVGRDEDAIASGERCVELYREVGDDDGLARGLVALGNALNSAGDSRVVEVFEEAAALTQRAGLRYWQANVLYGLANLDEQAGRIPEALDRLREAARICAEIGSTAIDACRVNLACLLVLSDEWEEATGILRELEERGTLAQLWQRGRYAALAVAVREGDSARERQLREEIEAEPMEDRTTTELLARADGIRAASLD